MTCENCIHNEICSNRAIAYCDGHFFKDKSRFVELPCKVGDTIYQTDGVRIYESRVKSILYDSGLGKVICDTDSIAFDSTAIKEKRVFLSREEAERALKEREKIDENN